VPCAALCPTHGPTRQSRKLAGARHLPHQTFDRSLLGSDFHVAVVLITDHLTFGRPLACHCTSVLKQTVQTYLQRAESVRLQTVHTPFAIEHVQHETALMHLSVAYKLSTMTGALLQWTASCNKGKHS